MVPDIVCIVEGDGEVQAAPVLVRRIADALGQHLQKVHGVRGIRSSLATDKLAKQVGIALANSADARLLLLFDADDDAACKLGPDCLARMRRLAPHRQSGAVLAVKEFENWFIAGVKGLWGRRGIPAGLQPPANVESIRGAKEWLSRNMDSGFTYRPTRDQAAFAALFDMQEARRLAPSFDKCWREVKGLLSGA
jgi:hypothetical protein